jgi:hypothetical protein
VLLRRAFPYDEIRFRFHTAKTYVGHSPQSITKRRGRRNCAPPATSLLAGRREQGGSLATGPQSAGKQCLSRAIASSTMERAIRRVPQTELPNELPPEPTSKDKEDDPYAQIVGTC